LRIPTLPNGGFYRPTLKIFSDVAAMLGEEHPISEEPTKVRPPSRKVRLNEVWPKRMRRAPRIYLRPGVRNTPNFKSRGAVESRVGVERKQILI